MKTEINGLEYPYGRFDEEWAVIEKYSRLENVRFKCNKLGEIKQSVCSEKRKLLFSG